MCRPFALRGMCASVRKSSASPSTRRKAALKASESPLPAAMEARSVDGIPRGAEWQYEPKWDGFRCLLSRQGSQIELRSKAGEDLARYFPELVDAALKL
jgi:ATP-dependent DNA ligase